MRFFNQADSSIGSYEKDLIMWNSVKKLNGKIRARASRWPCGQLVLQVEQDLFDLVPEGEYLKEVFAGTSWRDAKVCDLNDIGHLTSDREHVTNLVLNAAKQGSEDQP